MNSIIIYFKINTKFETYPIIFLLNNTKQYVLSKLNFSSTKRSKILIISFLNYENW